jgi:hypothetical protein
MRLQRNARYCLVWLTGFCAFGIFVLDYLWTPVWPEIAFEIAYKRLSWGTANYDAFFDSVRGTFGTGQNIIDLDERQIPLGPDESNNVRQLLKLASSRPNIRLGQTTDLSHLEHTGVIAARKVTLAAGSEILIGNKNLVIIAQDLEIGGGPSPARITAYRDKDVPTVATSYPGEKGAPGQKGGTLTLVVLGKIKDDQKLIVDLRGQTGGPGAAGTQPPPKGPAADKGAMPGRPRWSFRTPEPWEIEKFRSQFKIEIEKAADASKKLLEDNAHAFEGCLTGKISCLLPLCDEADWEKTAVGLRGENGAPGQTGGPGGDAGSPGQLTVYHLGDENFESQLRRAVVWPENRTIDSKQPARLGGAGGPAGKPGDGGPGGLGLSGDAFGACKAGEAGSSGLAGENADDASRGKESIEGDAATILTLDDLPRPYRAAARLSNK